MIKFNPEVHFLGKLCKRGHDYDGTGLSVRYNRNSRDCVECAAKMGDQWRTNNKDRYIENGKKYRSENKDKIKKYQSENKDTLSEYRKRHYAENKDEIVNRHNRYRSENKDKIAETIKRYVSINRKKLAEWKDQYNLEQISKLGDAYVKSLIKEQTGIPSNEIPQELIEMKREQLTFTRLLRETKNGITRTRD